MNNDYPTDYNQSDQILMPQKHGTGSQKPSGLPHAKTRNLLFQFLILLFALGWSSSAWAQCEPIAVYASDFASSIQSAFQMNGDATFVTNKIQLTSTANAQAGSAFWKNRINLSADKSFSSYFSFQITGTSSQAWGKGADGVAFVLQTNTATAFATGDGIGYQGVQPSIAVEFDTHDNTADPSDNHIAIVQNGQATSSHTTYVESPYDMDGSPGVDGPVLHVWVDYNGATDILEVRISNTTTRPGSAVLSGTVDLVTLFGNSNVFVGVTSATGGVSSKHEILDLYFINEYLTNGVTTTGDYCQAASNVAVSASPTTVNTGSSSSVTATLTKPDGSPVAAGVTVEFTTTGGGTFSSATATTNASGVATATFNATTAGSFVITAIADGGVTGTTNITVNNVAGNALDFDGVNDYVSFGSSNQTYSPFTVSAWVYTTSTAAQQTIYYGAYGWLAINGNPYVWLTPTTSRPITPAVSIPVNEWHHLALVATSGKQSVYVDGIEVASSTDVYSLQFGSAVANALGKYNTSYFQGKMDEVRLYNRALTACEIKASMNTTLQGNEANLLLYYKFDQGVAGGANAGLTTLTSNTGLNHGTLNSFALTGATSNWVASDAPYTGDAVGDAVVTTTSPATSIATTTATVSGNITSIGSGNATVRGVCYNTTGCPMITDGKTTENGSFGTGAFSASLTGLTAGTTYYARAYATNASGTSYGTEISFQTAMVAPGNALDFDGTNDYVSAASTTPNYNSFTVEAWIYSTDAANQQKAIIYEGPEAEFSFYNPRFSITNGTQSISFGTGTNPFSVPINEWHHVAMVVSPGASYIYVDGIAVLSKTNVYSGNLGSAYPRYLGNLAASWTGDQYFKGKMDEVRVYSRALSACEIKASMSTTLQGNEANLLLYYNFDQGVAGGANAGLTTLTSKTGTNNGTLNNFALTGATSNWVASTAPYTGDAIGDAVVTTTSPATSIAQTTATVSGNITSIGSGNATVRGVCYNTTSCPTIADGKTVENGSFATGAFSANLTGLSANTTYYARAYATNASGTSYGAEVSFTTLNNIPAAPVANTPTTITSTSFIATWGAVSGATSYIIDVAANSGFSPILTAYTALNVGNVLLKDVTGLTPNTQYYYRVRGVSSGGEGANSTPITVTTCKFGDCNNDGVISITEKVGINCSTGAGIAGDANGDGVITAPEICGDLNGDGTINNGEIGGDKSGDKTIGTGEIAGDKDGSGTIVAPEICGDVNLDGSINNSEIAGDASGDKAIGGSELCGNVDGINGIDGTEIGGDISGDKLIGTGEIAGDKNGNGSIVSPELCGDANLDGSINNSEKLGDISGNKTIDNDEVCNDANASKSIGTGETPCNTALAGDRNGDGSIGAGEIAGDVNCDGTINNGEICGDVNGDKSINNGEVAGDVSGNKNIEGGELIGDISGDKVITSPELLGDANANYIIDNPAPPTAVNTTGITLTGFTATWNLVSGATGYRIDVSTDPNFGGGSFVTGYADANAGTTGSYAVTGLTTGIMYYYRVRAVGTEATSANSPVGSALTGSTAWNGTAWSGGTPTSSLIAVINSNYTSSSTNPSLVCKDLIIASGKTLQINPENTVTVNGNLTNSGTIICKSPYSSGASGSLIIKGNILTPGTMIFERFMTYITPYNPTAHFVSIPMTTVNSSMFRANTFASYNQATRVWSNYSGALTVGRGYQSKYMAGTMVTLTGTFNNVAVPLATIANNYYKELVGNPYPSAIDWQAAPGWTKPGISPIIQYFNAVSGRYGTWSGTVGTNGATQYIPAMQGFFVSATSAGASLAVNKSAQVHSTALYQKSGEMIENTIKLRVSGGILEDETVVQFNTTANATFEVGEDAEKMFEEANELPHLYTLSADKQALTINQLPATGRVPMSFTSGLSGKYSIAADAFMFTNFATVGLKDLKTGTITDLRTGSYQFDYTAGENSERFELFFTNTATNIDGIDATQVDIYAYNRTIYVVLPVATAQVSVYDITGRLVYTNAQLTQGVNSFDIQKLPGTYIVKVIANEQVSFKKVVLQ